MPRFFTLPTKTTNETGCEKMALQDYEIEGEFQKPADNTQTVEDFIAKLQAESINAIDVPFAKNYLKVTENEDDLFIALCIEASKSFIQNYLNREFDEFKKVPFEFAIASLNLITLWYDNRGVNGQAGNNVGEAVFTFTQLVGPHRYIQIGAVGGAELNPATFPITPTQVEGFEDGVTHG